MDLRDWRTSKNLTLQQMARVLLMPTSSLSELERGTIQNISQATIARIWGATNGAVTANDVFNAWRKADSTTSSKHRAAGRSAMQTFRTAAKKPRK